MHFMNSTGEKSLVEHQEKEEYQRAVTEWNGCHFVLVVLRQVLDDPIATGLNRELVHSALLFLATWCYSVDRFEEMTRLNGVDAVVRSMRAFRNDAYIQQAAIGCFYNFTLDNDDSRRLELVEGGVIGDIFRALMAPTHQVDTPKYGTLLLGRLCDVAEPRFFDGLVELGAMDALARVVKLHMTAAEPGRQEVLSACRKLMTKIIV
jgi:hypothetical protein